MKKNNDIVINESIEKISKTVRCIGEDGTQYGIISTAQAIEKAYSKNLDIVMVSNGGDVPVVKIMNYDKYRYQLEKKRKEDRKKQKIIDVKEIKLTPKIAQNDISYKVKHAISFLEQGKHVRFKVFLRGREMSSPIVAYDLLKKVAIMVEEVGEMEKNPSSEGRYITMYVIPLKQHIK